MDKHTNKLVLIGLTFLIIPQIAFAAWWNPFSWKIMSLFFFPKIVTVQNSVAHNQVATTTDRSADIERLTKEVEALKKAQTQSVKVDLSKTKSSPVIEIVKPNIPIEAQHLVVENLAPNLQLMVNDRIKAYQSLADWLQASIKITDSRISILTDLSNHTRPALSSPDSFTQTAGKILLDAYQKDIDKTGQFKNVLNLMIGNTQQQLASLRVLNYNGTVITKAEFPQKLEELQTHDPFLEKTNMQAKQLLAAFNEHATSWDKTYDEARRIANTYISSNASYTGNKPPVVYLTNLQLPSSNSKFDDYVKELERNRLDSQLCKNSGSTWYGGIIGCVKLP